MYAGRVVCFPLLSHVEYAPKAVLGLGEKRDTLLTLEKRQDRQTDGRTSDITLTARRGQRKKKKESLDNINLHCHDDES